MSLILNLSSFKHVSRYPCDFCGRERGRRHFCNDKARRCFPCRRLRVNIGDSVYVNNRNKNLFCIRKGVVPIKYVCPECGAKIATADCKKHHSCFLHFCEKCNKGTFLATGRGTMAVAAEKHVCNTARCSTCYEYHGDGENHLCKLKPCSITGNHQNLGFFDFECRPQAVVEGCAPCVKKEKDYCQTLNIPWDRIEIRLKIIHGEVNATTVRCRRHVDTLWTSISSSAEGCESCNSLESTFCAMENLSLSRKDICQRLEKGELFSQDVRCTAHASTVWDRAYHIPNYLVIYFESEEHEKFSSVEFAEV